MVVTTPVLFGIIAAIVGIVGIVAYLYEDSKTRKAKRMNIATHPGFPFIGHYPSFGCSFNEFTQYLKGAAKLRGRLFGLFFGKELELVCADLELAEELLNSNKHQSKGFIFKSINSIMDGETGTGIELEKQKKLVSSVFSENFLDKCLPGICEFGDELVKDLKLSRGKNIAQTLKKLVTSLILETLTGNCLENERKMFNLLDESHDIDLSRTLSRWQRCKFLYYLTPSYLRQNQIKKEVDKILGIILENRTMNGSKAPSVLEFLFKAEESGELNDVKKTLLALIIASYQTLPYLIGFATYELSRKPLIQNQLLEEINMVTGGNGKSVLTSKQINEMKLLDCFFKEMLRIYTPNILTECTLTEDVKYKNTTILEGSSVLILLHAINNDAEYYENPSAFIPERYLPKPTKKNCSSVPFGGFKNYSGYPLIIIEFKTLLIKLIQNLKIEQTAGFDPEITIYGNYLKPNKGIFVQLLTRS